MAAVVGTASGYRPPLRDLRFVLDELPGVSDLLQRCGSTEFDTQTIDQVLSAVGQLLRAGASSISEPVVDLF